MSSMNRIQNAEAIEAPARTSDGELLARFLDRRDDAAFAELVARHGPMTFGVCRRVIGQHADAEDCFQAAFLSLATHGRKLADRPTVGPWLYTIARQIAVKALRSRRRRRWVFWESQPEPAAATASEATVDLDAALATLNEDERSAVVLCHLEGYTRAAAAKTLGWPEGTLSVRLSRALEKLRKKLGRPPLAVLAGAMVVMMPDQLPAATLASVRHLREGTLDDWAPPRTVELYRKAQPMKILHRSGPVAGALLAAVLIMIGGVTGWQWLQAQTDEQKEEPETKTTVVQPQGKKKSFAAAVEEMQKGTAPDAGIEQAEVRLEIKSRFGSGNESFARWETEAFETLDGALVRHTINSWSSIPPILKQIAAESSDTIKVKLVPAAVTRLEANQIVNTCKLAGFKSINYHGPQLFLGRDNESWKAAGINVPVVEFTADLTKSDGQLPDWTNGWQVRNSALVHYDVRMKLEKTDAIAQMISAAGGRNGPAAGLHERFERPDEEQKRSAQGSGATYSEFVKQIEERQRREGRVKSSLEIVSGRNLTATMYLIQECGTGDAVTFATSSKSFAKLIQRAALATTDSLSIRVGNSTREPARPPIRLVDPLEVNLVLDACRQAGIKAIDYAGQKILTGAENEYLMCSEMGISCSLPIVKAVIRLQDLEGDLPMHSNGWRFGNVKDQYYVVRAERQDLMVARLEKERAFQPMPVPAANEREEIERLAKLSADDFEKELAKKPSLLRERWKKSVEEFNKRKK
jgi:RNA polymerase sigma factor (sigma-70 family)